MSSSSKKDAPVKGLGKQSFDDVPDDFELPEGNLKKGKKYFVKYCSQCHSIYEDNRMDRGGQVLIGPTMFNVYGRASGIVPAEGSSTASMPEGTLWVDKPLMNYMKNPRLAVSANVQMNFRGISDIQIRADIVHYLKTLDHTNEEIDLKLIKPRPKIWGLI